jgi:hypothetical protein
MKSIDSFFSPFLEIVVLFLFSLFSLLRSLLHIIFIGREELLYCDPEVWMGMGIS